MSSEKKMTEITYVPLVVAYHLRGLALQTMKDLEVDFQYLWDRWSRDTPHFGGESGHRYDSHRQDAACVYCNRPRNFNDKKEPINMEDDQRLEQMTHAYLRTILEVEAAPGDGDGDETLSDAGFGIEDFDEYTLARARNDCAAFLAYTTQSVEFGRHGPLHRLLDDAADWDAVGENFWYDRQGHGRGFSDDPDVWGEDQAEQLSVIAQSFGEVDVGAIGANEPDSLDGSACVYMSPEHVVVTEEPHALVPTFSAERIAHAPMNWIFTPAEPVAYDGACGDTQGPDGALEAQHLCVGTTDYQPGEYTFDDFVLAGLRLEGWDVVGMEPGGAGPHFADWIVDEIERPEVDGELELPFLKAGLTLAKLPDYIGCDYFRWYLVRPLAEPEPTKE